MEYKIVEEKNGEMHINIFPKQHEFLSSTCDDALYGGAAGGGKSIAILLFALQRRLTYPRSRGIIFRRTYPELEKSIILSSRHIYSHFGAKYNTSKKVWDFPNGSSQEFGFCESEADVLKYHSAEYADMCFDEAGHFTEYQISYLTSRCRSSIPGVKPLIRLASNPGGVGHAHLLKKYIVPSKTNKIWTHHKTKKTTTFIPAKISDNPALAENDPDYVLRLKELPEKKYLALAEGRWDVFEGIYFTEFDPRPGMGVLDYIRKPEESSTKIIALDWGFADPACALWMELTPRGRIFVYRELYTTRRMAKELAYDIAMLTPKNENVEYLVASPEIWGKQVETESGGQPIQALMQDVFGEKITMRKANNARVPGWLKVREFMGKGFDGKPWLQISPNCENLIRTIPQMVHDEKRPEDIAMRSEDHACFTGETLVNTENGEKRIDEIKIGDMVLTRQGYRKVINWAMTNKSAKIWHLLLSNGTSIRTTANHPFWIVGRGFVSADDIAHEDKVLTPENKELFVISTFSTGEYEPVFNFTVENVHEYFANGVLVSNCEALRYGLVSVGELQNNFLSPYRKLSNYEKIFGVSPNGPELMSGPPLPSTHGGY